MPYLMSRSGREAFLDVREFLEGLHGCPKGPPGYLVVVGDPSGYPGVVERPYRMSGSGREAHLDVREWWRGPPGYPGVVRKP